MTNTIKKNVEEKVYRIRI